MHFFDKTSPLYGMERMMKTVPDFRSRASPGTPSCKLCTEYRRHACQLPSCPYLPERLAAGAVRYQGLAAETVQPFKHSCLTNRVSRAARRAGGFRFRSRPHRRRLEEWLKNAGPRASPRMLAAVYLLSASRPLWERVQAALYPDRLHWAAVAPGSLDTKSYALYRAAKGLWEGALTIEPDELADKTLIDDETLMLIINGLMLIRYGMAAMEVKQ